MVVKRTIVRRRTPGGFDGESRRGSGVPLLWRRPPGGAARRHGAHHGRRPHHPHRCGRAGDRGQDRRGGTAAGGTGGRARDRRERRHRDAGHDRHPPAHVADGDACLRRGLDPHPVLRLELPGAWPEVPPRGHRRGQPDLRLGSARGRRDHHGGLVAQPAYPRPRRGRARRAARGARAVRPGLRQHPSRPLGVDCRPRRAVVLQPAPGERHARDTSSPSTSPATRPSRRRRPSRRLASSACPSPPTPGCGAPPTTTASG